MMLHRYKITKDSFSLIKIRSEYNKSKAVGQQESLKIIKRLLKNL